jgi:hypothetical protein
MVSAGRADVENGSGSVIEYLMEENRVLREQIGTRANAI